MTDKFRHWVNENDDVEYCEGFTECQLTPGPDCFRPPNDRCYNEFKRKKQKGSEHTDGIDDLDHECYWTNGILICP